MRSCSKISSFVRILVFNLFGVDWDGVVVMYVDADDDVGDVK